jgi:hypothetical protein
MPSTFEDVIDVMGEWDWFGALKSRPDISGRSAGARFVRANTRRAGGQFSPTGL